MIGRKVEAGAKRRNKRSGAYVWQGFKREAKREDGRPKIRRYRMTETRIVE